MQNPSIPADVVWQHGMVLEPSYFEASDNRAAELAHLSGLQADPWPWGFTSVQVDDTALSAGQVRIVAEGIFPDGKPFPRSTLTARLQGGSAQEANFSINRNAETGQLHLSAEDMAVAAGSVLPAVRLVLHGGIWSKRPDWSPPTLLVGANHPLREDMNQQLGTLSALATGFAATLRMPGSEDRPVARVLRQVSGALVQGVGVMDALLSAPIVSAGRLGLEALRLALGVRSAAGNFDRIQEAWDANDQRGSMRRLLYAAEEAASGIGLPFRASVFAAQSDDTLLVTNMPDDTLLLAIEASRPADLIAARSWLEGAALAAPGRIQEALNRRVGGCSRRPVERDATIGISSGPLMALYQVESDASWRDGQSELVLAAKTPPPINTSFSVLIPEQAQGFSTQSGG